jgi:hypothetical protein
MMIVQLMRDCSYSLASILGEDDGTEVVVTGATVFGSPAARVESEAEDITLVFIVMIIICELCC